LVFIVLHIKSKYSPMPPAVPGAVPLHDTAFGGTADINGFVLAMDNSDGENFAPETITKDATPVDQLIQRATNTDGEQQGW